MSNKFHVNPETGEAKPCSAEIQCRFGGDAPHFDTEKEAQAAAESMMAEKYGSTTSLKKKGDESERRIHEWGTGRIAEYCEAEGTNPDYFLGSIRPKAQSFQEGANGVKYTGAKENIVQDISRELADLANKKGVSTDEVFSDFYDATYERVYGKQAADLITAEDAEGLNKYINEHYEGKKAQHSNIYQASADLRERMKNAPAEKAGSETNGSSTALKKKGDDEQPRFQMDQSEQWLEEARESREALQEAVMKDAIEKNMALVSAYHAEMKKPDKHSFKKPLRELAKIATAEYNKREAGKISYQDVLWYISSKNL